MLVVLFLTERKLTDRFTNEPDEQARVFQCAWLLARLLKVFDSLGAELAKDFALNLDAALLLEDHLCKLHKILPALIIKER